MSKVSIHAPAWGATSALMRPFSFPKTFQSTHPRGVRRMKMSWNSYVDRCFNPRTRVGCDLIRFMRRMGFIVFQSTHPRGVRREGL